MTHEEYLAGLETFGDAPEEARGVLDHVTACALCRREQRQIDGLLDRKNTPRHSPLEAALRWAAAAATVAILVSGARRPEEKPEGAGARYRIVGDASGVVAYTPGGVVSATAGTVSERTEVSR